MKRCIYSIELPNVGLCCGVYSNSKRPDGKFWAHFPKCESINCPYEHPELLEDAVFFGKTEVKTCKDCDNFIGCGDWDLCCENPPKDKVGWCGFLCYEDTEACENFKPKLRIRLRPDKPGDRKQPPADWISCIKCTLFEDCENKESRDGCYFGEIEEK